MGTLDAKVAIVTGGSQGIGRAIAARLCQEGAAVVVASRSAPRALSVPGLTWIETDVTLAADVTALVDRVKAEQGRIDVLVNNAGLQIEKPLDVTSDEDWDRLTGVNMKGLFLACRAVIPVMRAQGGGAIINIGSTSATFADPSMALYNASKAWVQGLTRSIAVDHGRDGIRCNAIAPGWIATDLAVQAFALADDPAAAERAAVARHPIGRLGTPEDIAAMAAWLASEDAAFASGQVFTVDGALTAASPIDPGALG